MEMLEQDMSYIVVYQRADGSAGIEECGDLDLAVVTAERLRNVDSVERPRIFKTEEIRYDFRPYYRVEVAEADEANDVTKIAGSSSGLSAVNSDLSDITNPFDTDDVSDPFRLDEPLEVPKPPPTPPTPPIPPAPPVAAEPSTPSPTTADTFAGVDNSDDLDDSDGDVSSLSEAAASAHVASEQLTESSDTPIRAGGLFSTEVRSEPSTVADLEDDVAGSKTIPVSYTHLTLPTKA